MNWFMIMNIISKLQQNIEEAAADERLTLNEILTLVDSVVSAAGIGDVRIIKKPIKENQVLELTLRDLIDLIKEVVIKLGLGDLVIITPEMIEDIKKRF